MNPLVRRLAGTAGMRLALLPLTAVASLTAQALIVRTVGLESFGVISLIVTLPILIPFADLGMSAAVTNAYARHEDDADELARIAWTALWCCAAALAAIVAVVDRTVGWTRLLGVDIDAIAPAVRIAFVVLVAAALPFGLGSRMLIGLDRVTTGVALTAIQPLLNLALVALAARRGAGELFYLSVAAAQFVTSVTAFAVAAALRRRSPAWWVRPAWGTAGQRRLLYRTAVPMFIITIGLPLALESHRIALAHLAPPAELGYYAIGMALYTPAWGVVGTAGMNLWPYFAGAKATDEEQARRQYRKVFRWSCLLALAGGAGFFGLAPYVTLLWSGHSVSTVLWLALAVLLIVQTAHLSAGMYLTDAAGLAFQAGCVALMAAATLGLMLLLIPLLGAPGAPISSALAIAVFQLLPGYFRASGRRPGGSATRAPHHPTAALP